MIDRRKLLSLPGPFNLHLVSEVNIAEIFSLGATNGKQRLVLVVNVNGGHQMGLLNTPTEVYDFSVTLITGGKMSACPHDPLTLINWFSQDIARGLSDKDEPISYAAALLLGNGIVTEEGVERAVVAYATISEPLRAHLASLGNPFAEGGDGLLQALPGIMKHVETGLI